MNASVAIQVLPMYPDKQKVVAIVDKVLDYIKSTGVTYDVSAFETSLEGDYDQLMDIVKEVPKVAVKAGADAQMVYVKINYFPESKGLTIADKVTKYQE
ncbi:thiamine-binding protein [Schleiferilactobacillus harbinensis]|uniref:Thiamine-binding protein n=1 Tax=Schleiferilactobacillus harbinensis TaxID=304207 RepID=A0A5P8M7S9_9LACO|nr:thiamine-binding protein [Schleiferilactobacillus harbinensis]QFR24334.1 thiamine-binding protein [Schleiferilactobacillus harbinensis]